jgi:hypothetical protein
MIVVLVNVIVKNNFQLLTGNKVKIFLKCIFLALIAFAPCAMIAMSNGITSVDSLIGLYSCIFFVALILNVIDVIIDCSPEKSRKILRFLNDQIMIAFFFGTIIYFVVNYINPSFHLQYWLAVIATFVFSSLQFYLVKK